MDKHSLCTKQYCKQQHQSLQALASCNVLNQCQSLFFWAAMQHVEPATTMPPPHDVQNAS
eukprot:4008452-Amphidinium_carterae.1